jgi:hypothetical protein
MGDSSSTVRQPISYKLDLKLEDKDGASAKAGQFYLPHGDSVFGMIVDAQVDILYVLSRYGFLLLFRVSTLERWACESLPSLAQELALAAPLGTNPQVPCRLPPTLDGITSIQLVCDPAASIDSKGVLPPLPSHIQRGLVLVDGNRCMWRVSLIIPIRSAAEDWELKTTAAQNVAEWKNLGSRSNDLYEAVGKQRLTPSLRLLDEMIAANQITVALQYVFQDVSGKLRTDATIAKVGAPEYQRKALEWGIQLSDAETAFLAARTPLLDVQRSYAAGQMNANANFLSALEAAHGRNPAAEDFLARVARDVDSPIRVIQAEVKKWLISQATSGTHPLIAAIGYVYTRHHKQQVNNPRNRSLPPPCYPFYTSSMLADIINELEYAIAPGADPKLLPPVEDRIKALMYSFINRGHHSAHAMTPPQRAATIFWLIEVFMCWAHREGARQRRATSPISVDEAIRHILGISLIQTGLVDLQFLHECVFPLGMAFINGPDAVQAIQVPNASPTSATSPTAGATSPSSGSVTSASVTSPTAGGIKPSLGFMPTWMRVMYDLIAKTPANDRHYAITHVKNGIIGRLTAPTTPPSPPSKYLLFLVFHVQSVIFISHMVVMFGGSLQFDMCIM